jgi:hypothetical protein
MTAFALATAACGWLLHWNVEAVIAFGVLLHLVSLAAGIALGPPVPPRRQWVHRA